MEKIMGHFWEKYDKMRNFYYQKNSMFFSSVYFPFRVGEGVRVDMLTRL